MSSRLSVEERRAHLIEAAIGLAEKKGVAGVTTRDVAQAAGVSLGVVHYCFENKDALMTELAKALSMELRDSVDADETVWQDAGSGIEALQKLVRAGLELMWLNVEATPERQLLTYETTTYALREGESTPAKLAIAREQYTFNDSTVADILDHAREATGTEWSVPVQTLSRFTLNMIDGLVLRWLVDNDSAAVRTQLDLTTEMVTRYAVHHPGDASA
ncbi:TetR/AcrR family transcriptional regulator [Nocardia higoensis]|uniref:TetR/AcrR family transcriptional regulator n=1 Tax=Nocardia higoensis TaxID=228599 RepID=UPI000592DE2A|nr:TetR/AcrR family transcriptional regulator [Nocardia higoensis]